jgi:hypothetical protein
MAMPARRAVRAALLIALAGGLLWSGLWRFPGPLDNDWPLLMWLATRARVSDLSPLAVGHYPPLQLLYARAAWPLFGSTLAAAKVLSVAGAVASAWLVARLAERLSGSWALGTLALLAFATCPELLLTGQSEFADAPALACWLAGLSVLLQARSARAALLGGALLGLAGSLRLHFEAFGFATLLGFAALQLSLPEGERLPRRAPALLAALAGLILALSPSWGVNLIVHGRPGSAVAHTFLGQVLFGYSHFDLPGTYALHPLAEVLAQHKLRLLELVGDRLRSLPSPWPWAALLGAACLLWRPAAQPRALRQRALLLWLLTLVYAAFVVAPSWGFTHRLLLPLVALVVLGTAAALGGQVGARPPPRPALARAALVVLIALLLPKAHGDRWRALHALRGCDVHWQRSRELTAVLRRFGLREAREAFVTDWDRFLVDDPLLLPFYDWGFWNLLVPAFAAERPSPVREVRDPARFAAFLARQDVRFVVLSRESHGLDALAAVARGQGELAGFARLADLPADAVFVRR